MNGAAIFCLYFFSPNLEAHNISIRTSLGVFCIFLYTKHSCSEYTGRHYIGRYVVERSNDATNLNV